ncbi:hypothetical protein CORC01_07147 [Colletotrichum orchidophilum]|uniref:Uncharacterized protein n=1 Tax=Colletotrichum orchidophilum TaxID=1209926 RepID=A0A1G4B8C9_9PEZI|nr:uncharacterized protein CORC01_07147 [Colletotrichum orchidophilum]OHE97532.1 hypothetical protein CORC01_07147 [Colletotrichum orchidophilum]
MSLQVSVISQGLSPPSSKGTSEDSYPAMCQYC